MAFPDQLLEQARLLANLDKNRPTQASLRRAVSTAYYALFHLLTIAAVANWKTARHRADLARAFQHGKMYEVCKTCGENSPDAKHPSFPNLQTVASNFMQLQQHRQDADYDNSKKWTRTEVRAQVELAAAAFESWNRIKGEPIAGDFLLRLLIGDKHRTRSSGAAAGKRIASRGAERYSDSSKARKNAAR
jgi:uncharacterized protein (UPF0332 family)